jgi:hypothetical protein
MLKERLVAAPLLSAGGIRCRSILPQAAVWAAMNRIDVFQPFGGFADNTPVVDGYVTMPDIPGGL